MGQVTLPSTGPIYLDASAFIYSIEKIEPYATLLQPLWHEVTTGELWIMGSELLLLETLVKPVQLRNHPLEVAFRELLTNTAEVELVPITRVILEKAAQLRATLSLKTPDAIHAATALQLGCQLFITNDAGFRRVNGLSLAVLKDFV